MQTVFDAITDAATRDASSDPAADRAIFDGRYQCRRCGTVRQIGTFAGAARPPKNIGTDCEHCDAPRRFDAIELDAESVKHQWTISFEDIYQDPYRIEVTAESKTAARTQVEHDYPDRMIELVLHNERV